MGKQRKIAILVMWCSVLSGLSLAQDLPNGVAEIPLAKVKWVAAANGLETANLLSNPTQAGPYLILVKWPPHKKLTAHKHPDVRYGMVISGVHYIGYGDKFDEKKLRAHAAGTFFNEPVSTGHFAMTKEEGAILYIYGIGPSGSTPLE